MNVIDLAKYVNNTTEYVEGSVAAIKNTTGETIGNSLKVITGGGATGGVSVGTTAGVATASTLLANAVASAPMIAYSTLAAAGLMVTENVIAPNLKSLMEDLAKTAVANHWKIVDLLADTESAGYKALYSTEKDGVAKRALPADLVNAFFMEAGLRGAWGKSGTSQKIVIGTPKQYSFPTSTTALYGACYSQLTALESENAESIANFVTHFAERVSESYGVGLSSLYIVYTISRDNFATNSLRSLSAYDLGNTYTNVSSRQDTDHGAAANASYVNSTAIPSKSMWANTLMGNFQTSTGAQKTVNTYSPSSLESEDYTLTTRTTTYYQFTRQSPAYMVFDNMGLKGETSAPWNGFKRLDAFDEGTMEVPDGTKTLEEWAAENGKTVETVTDPEGNKLYVLNPYTSDMPATEAASDAVREGGIDPASEDETEKKRVTIANGELTDGVTEIEGDPDTIDPPTPTPNPTPVFPPPSVAASAGLFAIYNPTLTQVKEFSRWMWSSSLVDQLLKVFSDPMDGIIGFHTIYTTPETDGTSTIKLGYLDSEVTSYICKDQYKTIDCGEVQLYEYYGSALDYAPYTNITLYLPFVGFRSLDPQKYMGGVVNVEYIVDILTGCTTVNIYSIKNGQKRLCDSYSGGCSTQLPISSGSYMSAVAGVTSAAVGGFASGGVAGAALGVAGAALGGQIHTDTKISGSISGNAGAMGCKIPYLIIDRNTPKLPANYNKTQGFPASTSGTLGSFAGYTRVKDCHLDNIIATQTEKEKIMTILKNGVIV